MNQWNYNCDACKQTTSYEEYSKWSQEHVFAGSGFTFVFCPTCEKDQPKCNELIRDAIIKHRTKHNQIMQERWDQYILNNSSQMEVLDYMKEEFYIIKTILIDSNITSTDKQIMHFWERYSESMDGSWLSASKKYIKQQVFAFLDDPEQWIKNPLYLVEYRKIHYPEYNYND